MKPFLQLAAFGLVAFTAWKIGSFFLVPLLLFVLKVALFAALVWLVVSLFKRNDKGSKSDSTPDSTSSSTST